MRPAYHFSVDNNWKNDPQRPIYLDGEYHYYDLYNADYINGDCWSGCMVVDEGNTA